jgi:hypothetical protein
MKRYLISRKSLLWFIWSISASSWPFHAGCCLLCSSIGGCAEYCAAVQQQWRHAGQLLKARPPPPPLTQPTPSRPAAAEGGGGGEAADGDDGILMMGFDDEAAPDPPASQPAGDGGPGAAWAGYKDVISCVTSYFLWYHVWYHMWYLIWDVIGDVIWTHVISHYDIIYDIMVWCVKMNVISHMMCFWVAYDFTCDITDFGLWYHIIVISQCDIIHDITCDVQQHHMIYIYDITCDIMDKLWYHSQTVISHNCDIICDIMFCK